jgi:hypothetical protein
VTLRVFGRTEYGEPLIEVGTAEEGADVLAEFPGDWVELVAFPELAIHWIIHAGAEVDAV